MSKTTSKLFADIDSLAGFREEIRLQAHLFSEDMKDRWHSAEAQWVELQSDMDVVRKSLESSRAELTAGASLSADNLRQAYQDLREALKKL